MPEFDIYTVILVLVVGHAVSIILLSCDLFQYETTRFDYVLLLGRACQLLGWCLILGRKLLPHWLYFCTGNTIVVIGWTFEALAIISLRYLVSKRCLTVYGMLCLLSILLIWSELESGFSILLLSFLWSIMFLIPSGVLLLPGRSSSPLQKVSGAMLLVCSTLQLWRGFDIWLSGHYSLFGISASHIFALLAFQGLLLLGGMGYALIKKEKLSREMKRVADTDHLTKLYNRRAFLLLADKYHKLAARRHASIAVLMIDIDWFKAINDQYGHTVGDSVIANLADVIRQQIRESDIACRYGGEEFVVLLPDCGREEALKLAERLRQAVEKADCDGVTYTVSIGVAAAYGKITKLESLINRADAAMYKAKEAGRNCVYSN